MAEKTRVSFADEQACREVTFKWAVAWDTKVYSLSYHFPSCFFFSCPSHLSFAHDSPVYPCARSADQHKDRALFLSIAAPSVNADYTAFPAVNWRRELKAEEYFDTAFKEENLGNKNCMHLFLSLFALPTPVQTTPPPPYVSPVLWLTHIAVQTHHLLGASSFSHTSATQLTGNWQTYARHVRRFADRRVKEWNSSNVTEFTYVNINGEWKLAGVRPHTVVCVTGEHGDVVGAVE